MCCLVICYKTCTLNMSYLNQMVCFFKIVAVTADNARETATQIIRSFWPRKKNGTVSLMSDLSPIIHHGIKYLLDKASYNLMLRYCKAMVNSYPARGSCPEG